MLKKLKNSFEYKYFTTKKFYNIFKMNTCDTNDIYINNKDRFVISTESIDEFNAAKNDNLGKKIIGTHSGAFHADEVLATMLIKYSTDYKNSWIVRSRNNDILKEADLVCDVGAVYDDKTIRFDHHQKEFAENFDKLKNIKMSSAGLIYKHYGKHIIENLLKLWNIYDKNEKNIDRIYEKVYVNLIAYVDAADNGINQYSDTIIPRYLNTTSYGARVGRLNPNWNEPEMDQSVQFKIAQDVAEEEFTAQLKYVTCSFLPAYQIVKDAVNLRFDTHYSGRIIIFSQGCPWKEHLYDVENEMGLEPDNNILFAIYGSPNDYRVQTISLNLGNFTFRKGLRQEWRGIRDEALNKLTGLTDTVFVHANGFIGGAKSLESALKLAELSMTD